MEYAGIESIKKTYKDILQERGDYAEAAKLNVKDFKDPVFDGFNVHPEEEPSIKDINNRLQQIGIDFTALDLQFISAAGLYNDLMEDILLNLDTVDDIIAIEKERIQDINIIAGNLSEFTTVKTLRSGDFTGTVSVFDDLTYTTNATTRNSVTLTIDDISGNGYEGNDYVYNNDTFEKEAVDTSQRDFMLDGSSTSYYEYSRITMTERQAHYPPEVNFDNTEAECTLSLYSDVQFNTLRIQSNITNMEVVQVSTSTDGGVTYNDSMTKPIQINNSEQKYDDSDYIYGAGLLVFPRTQYAKVRLRSKGMLNDKLAFTKILLNESTLLINITFSPKSYISEFLVPILTREILNSKDTLNIPVSVIVATILARTGTKPFNAGAFNFWNLPYDETISDQESDDGFCAFYSSATGMRGILQYCLTNEAVKTALVNFLPEQTEETDTSTTETQTITESNDPNEYKYTGTDERGESYTYFYDEQLSLNYRYMNEVKWYFVHDPMYQHQFWFDISTNLWNYTRDKGNGVLETIFFLDSDILNERLFYDVEKKAFYTTISDGTKYYYDYNQETGDKIYYGEDYKFLYDFDTGILDRYNSDVELCYKESEPDQFYYVQKQTYSKKMYEPITLLKSFIRTLTQNKIEVSDTENVVLDAAVKNISNFTGWNHMIQQFVADYLLYGPEKYEQFLIDCCDINLNNLDLGSAMGKDLDGNLVKNYLNIVPEKGAWSYPSGTTFTLSGLTVVYPKKMMLTEVQQFIIGAIYTWWLKAALEISSRYLGLTFNDGRATAKRLRIQFINDSNVEKMIQCRIDEQYNNYQGYTNETHTEIAALVMDINMAKIEDYFDLHNPSFLTSSGAFDIAFVESFIHGIMAANIYDIIHYDLNFFFGCAALIMGTCEYYHTNEIRIALANPDTIVQAYNEKKYPEVIGYLLLRYLLKQASRARNLDETPDSIKDTYSRKIYYYDGTDKAQFYYFGPDNNKIYVEERWGNQRALDKFFMDPEKEKTKALAAILKSFNETDAKMNVAQSYVEDYELRQYDTLDFDYSAEEDKYEPYFSRKDYWDSAYEQAVKDATQVISLETAKRHVIRINNLVAFSNEYSNSSYMQTAELLQGAVDCIAVFASEYIPSTFPTDLTTYNIEPYISYVLTINGIDYDIVPINSHKQGIKMIRYSNYSLSDNYTVRLQEPIKSARLTVKLTTPDNSYSPYVSNIKVCIGKAVTK